MAFTLKNPYTKWRGRQNIGSGNYAVENDPFGEFWAANPGGGNVVASQFAPYASQEYGAWEGPEGNYGYTNFLDFDRLNADTDAKVAADMARYDSLAGWDDESLKSTGFAPNYAGQLAKTLGMTPKAFEEWAKTNAPGIYNQTTTGSTDYAINPFVGQRTAVDTLISQKGLSNNPDVMKWRNSLDESLNSGGEAYVSRINNSDMSGWSGIGKVLKGAAFALLPAAVGPALQGTAALGGANFGGGLAGDVLSGAGLKALRTGLSLGGSVLSGMDGQYRPVASSTNVATADAATPVNAFSDSVLSQAPSGAAPQSLSNSVMTTSAPQNVVRRPQIRLSPGFRRGQ